MPDETEPSEIPEGFRSITPEEAWKRVTRENAARKKAEAELTGLRGDLESLQKAAKEAESLRKSLADAESRAARAESRIPLIRVGIEDDEIGSVIAARHAAVGGDTPFGDWLAKQAKEDKVTAPYFATATAKATAPPNPDRGSGAVAATPGSRVTWEQYQAERRKNQGYTPLMRQYMAENGIVLDRKKAAG